MLIEFQSCGGGGRGGEVHLVLLSQTTDIYPHIVSKQTYAMFCLLKAEHNFLHTFPGVFAKLKLAMPGKEGKEKDVRTGKSYIRQTFFALKKIITNFLFRINRFYIFSHWKECLQIVNLFIVYSSNFKKAVLLKILLYFKSSVNFVPLFIWNWSFENESLNLQLRFKRQQFRPY
jgi:hypothetical protein